LLGELAGQEARAKAIERELATLNTGSRLGALDRKQLAALARVLRGELAAGPGRAPCFIQRALGDGRLACVPFRPPRRRGYRFRATGCYVALLPPILPTLVAPTGFEPVFTVRHALAVSRHAVGPMLTQQRARGIQILRVLRRLNSASPRKAGTRGSAPIQ